MDVGNLHSKLMIEGGGILADEVSIAVEASTRACPIIFFYGRCFEVALYWPRQSARRRLFLHWRRYLPPLPNIKEISRKLLCRARLLQLQKQTSIAPVVQLFPISWRLPLVKGSEGALLKQAFRDFVVTFIFKETKPAIFVSFISNIYVLHIFST